MPTLKREHWDTMPDDTKYRFYALTEETVDELIIVVDQLEGQVEEIETNIRVADGCRRLGG